MAFGEEQLGELGPPDVVPEVGGEVGIPAQRAALVEHALERRRIELGQPLARRLLRSVERRPDDGGRARQRLRFPAALPQVHPDQGCDVRGNVLPALAGLPLDDTRHTAARDQREPGREDEGDDGPREEETLPELPSAAEHVEGRERSYAGLPGGASLFIFMHL